MPQDNGLISICIPTRNRPNMLLEAIGSCFQQRYRPLEIVIGDDSSSTQTEELVRGIELPDGITLNYALNTPPLGQSRNVSALFSLASGSRMLLLHDDDFLCPSGLDLMASEWDCHENVMCVFGKQAVVTEDGQLDERETILLNQMYFRNGLSAGVQPSNLSVGLLLQLPSNSFLISTAVARRVGYRSEKAVGQAVDADFAVRLGALIDAGSIVFVDAYVSAYRLSSASIMRSPTSMQDLHLFFQSVADMNVPPGDFAAQEICLGRIGSAAVLDAATAGDRKLALRILFSKHFRKSYLSPHMLAAGLFILSPNFAAAIRPTLKRAKALQLWLALKASALPTGRSNEATDAFEAEREEIEALKVALARCRPIPSHP